MSNGTVIFPCFLAGKNVRIKTEVVEADFPLLLGNSMLKRAGAVLFLREEKALIMNTNVKMRETNSGHFCLKIELPKEGVDFAKIDLPQDSVGEAKSKDIDKYVTDCLLTSEGALTYKDVEKLHNMFGHVSIRRLKDLIKNSKKWTTKVKNYLEDIEDKSRSCKLHRKAKPSQNVSLPRASNFNEIVTLDLKDCKEGIYRYILYIVDMFSRLTVGALISDKNPSTS